MMKLELVNCFNNSRNYLYILVCAWMLPVSN